MTETLTPGLTVWHEQLGPGTLLQHYAEIRKLKIAFWFFAPSMNVSEEFVRIVIFDHDTKSILHDRVSDCTHMGLDHFQRITQGPQQELNLRSGAQ